MINRAFIKLLTITHKLLYFKLYFRKNAILYGLPKLICYNKIKIGKNIRINDKVFLHGANGIEFGDNVTLSHGACLISESYNIDSFDIFLEKKHKGKKIIIGNNVWICANAIILPGVKISDNIIVGAGSVVTHDLLESNTIYAGNPAKKIRNFGD